MAGVTNHTYANNDRVVTGRQFGVGNGARKVWNLAGMDSDRALIHPILYKIDWGGIQQYYSTARTNLLLRSQQFSQVSAWTEHNATCSGGSIDSEVAPDGTTTGDKILEDTATAQHYLVQGVTVTAISYAFTIYLKAGERTLALVQFETHYRPINLVTGAQGTGSGTGVFTVTDAGNGWWKVVVVATPAAGTKNLIIGPATGTTSSPTFNYAGDAAKGIYAWGAQLEAGSAATSYIPTTTAAVTVTDYSTDSAGKVTFASAPSIGTQLTYKDPYATNGYRHFGIGDGSATQFSLPFAPRDPFVLAAGVLQGNGTATNLVIQSQTIQSFGTPTNVTCSGGDINAIVAPDGTLTADLLRETTASGLHEAHQTTASPNVTGTFSVYAKDGGRGWCWLSMNSGGTANYFNLATGQIGATAPNSPTITSLENGWYRLTLTMTMLANVSVYLGIASGNGGISYTGDTAKGIYFWGAQLETGSVATPYIPTTTVAKTGDYTVAPSGDVTFVSAPADTAVLTWTGNMGHQR